MSNYLKTFAEVFRVRHEPGVLISFVEPGTAADLGGSLLPVYSVPLPLLDLYIIPLSIDSYNHLPLLLSYCTVSMHTNRYKTGVKRRSLKLESK